MKYDTVVIGSGASGMCAALGLARRGQRVALVERCEHLAPLLRRFQRNGWWCDPGLHYVGGLHPCGPLTVIFRYLGISDAIQATPMDPDGYDIIHADGQEPIRIPTGAERVRETLMRHYPGSRRAIRAYFDRIEAIFRETPFLSFDLPGDALSTRQEQPVDESLTHFLTRHGAEPALAQMLGRYGYYLYGVEGHECPLMVHAIVLGLFYSSAHSLARGGDEIVDAFQRGLALAGVDTYCGRAVAALEVDDHRRLQGVRLEGDERLSCDACVCTIHPQLLPDLLPPRSVRRAFLSRIGSLENTFAPFAVFLEVDAPPNELQRSNCYFLGPCGAGSQPVKPPNQNRERKRPAAEACAITDGAGLAAMACGWEVEGRKSEGRRSRDLRPSTFDLRPSTFDFRPSTSYAHVGRKSLCLLRVGPTTLSSTEKYGKRGCCEGTYETLKRKETQRTVEMFVRHFPAQEGRFRVLDASTPSTYESYTGTVGGCAYGVKHGMNQMGLTTLTPLKGLYLAGQSIVAPGLLGTLISGLLAIANILGRQSVWDEVRKCR